MRKLVVMAAAIVSFGFVSAAFAADMPVKAPVAIPFSWTGFYVGVQAGYSGGNSIQYFTAGPGSTDRYSLRGALGGGTLGFNWQFDPHWVAGLEADLSSAGLHGSTGTTATYGCGTGCTSDINSFGTARVRIGYAAGNFLYFATGGYAYARIHTVLGGSGPAFDVVSNRGGWTAGGGIEYAINHAWSAKIEYLHADFNDFVWTTTAGCGSCFTDARLDMVRVGVNYKIGWLP